MSYVVFDLETTGFSAMSCDIIQFAYIQFDDANQFVKAENLYFYYEGMSWSQEAADASHHLSLDFLRQYKDDFKSNLLKMYSVLNRANVCGHNSNHFDCPFVKTWLYRMGLSDFDFAVKQDTMLAFKPITKRAKISLIKLTTLCGYDKNTINYCASVWFGDNNIRGPHDAAYDVAATSLLTLEGVRKNYIKFDFPMRSYETADVEDFMLDDELEDSKPNDPKQYLVKLEDAEDYKGFKYHLVCHNRNLYMDPGANITESELTSYSIIPTVFRKVGDIYTCFNNGISLQLSLNDAGDFMTIKTPYVEISDTDIDIEEFIKNSLLEV